jgi:hypothetical protein
MKRITLLSVLTLGMAINSIAQSLERIVISSGCGEATSSTNEFVQFTIGQSFFTETLSDNKGNFLTQGFEQPSNSNNERNVPSTFIQPDVEYNTLGLYPNPAVDFTNVTLNLIDDDNAKISILDMWGQPLRQEDFKATQGKNVFKFVFNKVPAGMYTISVYANRKYYYRKLLIVGTKAEISLK